jgi:carboxyl-terminal processing protease
MKMVEVQSSPVLNKKIIETAKGRVGYLTFNSHDYLAEQQLISAISQFRDSNIQDLVLDLRYNGGGLLDVASELAYMIAGPTQTNGKIFEKTIQNDKQTISQSDIAPFYSNSRFSSAPSALPYLGLKQVTILTSNDTCSASEAIINGLRGIDVKVNLIGAQTCGKPTGFYPTDNCGTTYFSVQFTGVNHKGFGDYPDGFAPTCPVADDYSKELGDPLEKRLAVGLSYIANGQCPASGQSQGPAPRDGKLYRSPLDAIKIINRPK